MKKLNIEYIDLMLLHHPGTNDVEVYRTLEQAVEAGRIRSIGLSNWHIEELDAFLPQVSITPAVVICFGSNSYVITPEKRRGDPALFLFEYRNDMRFH